MAPTIDDRDLLLVDVGERRFRDDGLYVIARDQGLSVKRLRRRFDHKLMISSDHRERGSSRREGTRGQVTFGARVAARRLDGGHYTWLKRPLCARARADAELSTRTRVAARPAAITTARRPLQIRGRVQSAPGRQLHRRIRQSIASTWKTCGRRWRRSSSSPKSGAPRD